jgi:hypothetical protein
MAGTRTCEANAWNAFLQSEDALILLLAKDYMMVLPRVIMLANEALLSTLSSDAFQL